jgi:hypothetical protein
MSSGPEVKMQVEVTKKCTSCKQPPLPLSEFVSKHGKETKQCKRCRDKAKKTQQRPEAKSAKAECNRVNGSTYSKVKRERIYADADQRAEYLKKQAALAAAYRARHKISSTSPTEPA